MRNCAVLFVLMVASCLALNAPTKEQENKMRAAIRDAIHNTKDSNGLRLLVPGLIRLCFHDCALICDGCVDTRRVVQPANNGLAATWMPMRALWKKDFQHICSLADFYALACAETTDYASEKGENLGSCKNSKTDGSNDCRYPMKIQWGRRDCEHPQTVSPLREIPNADEDPYEFFPKHFKMTEKEAVCIMGSHTLGHYRKNESGFEGKLTDHEEALTNDFYKMMVDPSLKWRQVKREPKVDGKTVIRNQWEDEDGKYVRVNSDFSLLYKIPHNFRGRAKCALPEQTRNPQPTCQAQKTADYVHTLAKDNKEFLQCFSKAMDKMLTNGYHPDELIGTGGGAIPPPKITTTTSTEKPTTTPKTKKGKKSGGKLDARKKMRRMRRRKARLAKKKAAGGGGTSGGGLVSSLLNKATGGGE